jgi:cobalt-zinc-cadmium resistance protein CzcA
MLWGLTEWVIERRAITLFVGLLVAAAGLWSFHNLPHYLFPEISPPEVQVISTHSGRPPEEVERQVTIPIELAMAGVSGVEVVRSRTMFGLSVVSVLFEAGTDGTLARHVVEEGLRTVALPSEVQAQLGPAATGSGEVYRYELQSDGTRDLTELRSLNDWVVIPRLTRAVGVAQVVNFGGFEREYTLTLDPHRLERYGFTFDDVVKAVQSNNASAGGGVLRRGDMEFVIHGRGLLTNENDIASTVINTIGGIAVRVHDVAAVEIGSRAPVGIFGKDETAEAVEGIVLMTRGEDLKQTLNGVREAVGELNARDLPAGVRIVPFYDREAVVSSAFHTVGHSLRIAIGLVMLAVLAFVGSPGMATLVGLAIPFSLLVGLGLLRLAGVPLSVFSIGAVDFGILAAATVVIAENIGRRLAADGAGSSGRIARQKVLAAADEVQWPVLISFVVLACAYLPMLTLRDIEGQFFRPKALTMVFSLVGGALFSVLLVPPLASLIFEEGRPDSEIIVLNRLRPIYTATLRMLLYVRWLVVGGLVAGTVAVAVFIAPKLGFDFLPWLDEGVIWIRADFPEGMSLDQTAEFGDRIRRLALEFPGVKFAASQAGRNDAGTDPFPPSCLETLIGLESHGESVAGLRKRLVLQLGERLRSQFPTTRFSFQQPMIESVTEDTNGTSADLAVEITGADLDVLRDLGEKTVAVLKQVRGAVDVNVEQEGPQPQLLILPNRARGAQYGVKIEDVNQLISVALGGAPIATLYEGERQFSIAARFDREAIQSLEAIGNLPVYTDSGIPIPLSQVADFSLTDGPTIITRADGQRRITVRTDIVGRDQNTFVAEARQRFAEQISIPHAYQARWIGMIENLARAGRHFRIAAPITVFLILALLAVDLRSPRDVLLVVVAILFALAAGVLILYVKEMSFTISSGFVGAALCGVFLMDVMLLVHSISSLQGLGIARNEAIVAGAADRFRSMLMTTFVAIAALFPAAISRGLGADAQGTQADVVIWGLLVTLPIKLFAVPVMYRFFSWR